MASSVLHAALPYPVKGARYTVVVPYLDSTGTPTDPTTPDTEVNIDNGGWNDCTEEVTTLGTGNGMGFITLTGDELNGSMIAVVAKVASGPKNTLLSFYPRVLPTLRSGTAQAGAAGSITLDSGASASNNAYVGCIVKTTGGTGGGGGSGSLGNQARVITAYNGSTKIATVTPNWETTPDVTTTFAVLYCELAAGAALRATTAEYTLDVTATGGAGVDWANVEAPTTTVGLSGTTVGTLTAYTGNTPQTGDAFARIGAAGAGLTAVGGLGANAITAASIAADAITDAKVASDVTIASVTGAVGSVTGAVGSVAAGGITSGSFAAGAIDAAAIATDAIGSAELAASAVTEIQSGLATAAALTTAQADLDDIQARLPAGLVAGRMDASVGAMAADVVTAASIATDAFGALELAAGAASEIATAVRAELTTELARVDVATSTRLAPTVAGRTLDVTATGEAGVDWANIGSPTSTVSLSGTTVGVVSSLAAGAAGLLSIAAAECNRLAEIVMRRTTANVEASAYGDTLGARSLYGAVARLAHKVSLSGATMTVTKSDDTAALTTATVATDPDAEAMTSIDPAA